MLSRLFIAALRSPAGKGLLFVMFNSVLSLSHVVYWVRCGAWLYRFLIFAAFFIRLAAKVEIEVGVAKERKLAR